MSTEKCESYTNSRKTSSVGCISWLSHLIPHRHHGKSLMTSSSCSDDESDTNDAAVTSYRDVTGGRRGPSVSGDQLASSPVSTGSPTDVVETFDIYYMLPSTGREKVEHRELQPPAASRWVGRRNWDHHGELTLNERRRPDVNCLLDAVPPTPTCCNDLRAATLPAARLNDWTSPPPTGFEHYKIPAAPLTVMYSRPRCACLACSDLCQPTSDDSVLYRQPTSTKWRDHSDDVYYNSNQVDIDQLRRGCSRCGHHEARSAAAAGRQGPPLMKSNHHSTSAAFSSSYDAVPTPIPLTYENVRFWRAKDTMGPQYSVPVRLIDSDVIYDNQDTFDQLQWRRRDRHHNADMTAATGGDGRLAQVPETSDVGNIMRFVELRQVRATNDHEDLQRGFRSYATEDRYLVTPTVAERTTPRNHLYYRHVKKSDAVYVNVENAPTWTTSASQQISSDPLLEEDTEHCPGPENCDATTEQEENAKESCKETIEFSNKENEESSHSETNPDFCENTDQNTRNIDLHETRSTAQMNEDMSNKSSSCYVLSQSQNTVSSDATRARPSTQIRLSDAYLLRMSPPPPPQQADGRRRAAYSDPVRWVSPISVMTDQQRREVDITAPRHATTGRPNGFRLSAGNESSGSAARTVAMTCTNEALEEAIQRRNRKCKPSVLRRLQAAKAIGNGGQETTAPLSSFEPIFEGVTRSLRRRSASLSDCNAMAKSHGHAVNF